MPRYFVNVRDGDLIVEDTDGFEAANLALARFEALADARHIIADRLKAGQPTLNHQFEITDEVGQILSVIFVKEALTFER